MLRFPAERADKLIIQGGACEYNGCKAKITYLIDIVEASRGMIQFALSISPLAIHPSKPKQKKKISTSCSMRAQSTLVIHYITTSYILHPKFLFGVLYTRHPGTLFFFFLSGRLNF